MTLRICRSPFGLHLTAQNGILANATQCWDSYQSKARLLSLHSAVAQTQFKRAQQGPQSEIASRRKIPEDRVENTRPHTTFATCTPKPSPDTTLRTPHSTPHLQEQHDIVCNTRFAVNSSNQPETLVTNSTQKSRTRQLLVVRQIEKATLEKQTPRRTVQSRQ